MRSAILRIVGFAVASICLFAVTVAVVLQTMPAPRTHADYLVAGSLGTFAALAVLFIVLVTTWLRARDVFFQRRERRPPVSESG